MSELLPLHPAAAMSASTMMVMRIKRTESPHISIQRNSLLSATMDTILKGVA